MVLENRLSERDVKLLVVVGTLAHMGGAERQALYLVEHLASLGGCTVEILTFEDGNALRPALDEMGVRVHVFPYYFRWPRAKRARALARLAVLLRYRIKPDALLPFVGIHSKTIALVWPYSGARFCWWNQQDEGRDLHGTATEGRVLRKVSTINSNSAAGRDFLAETYGLDRDRILIYNNGTPVPDLTTIPRTWKARLDLVDRAIVSMTANIIPFKDHATLIQAWVRVKAHFGENRAPVLLLAGHLREQETVTQLKLRAFELGLSASDVRFLGPVSDVADLMLSSDVVVHSSLTEGCPNAVCEAMALGRTVVATDIPGCRQALGDAGEQWLAAPRDPDDLAARIIKALGNEELRAAVGEVNRARIKSEFSMAQMNEFFQTQIEKGLGSSLS